MSNFPQLFGQNSTILWSRYVVLMSMKLTMSKKRVFLMYSDHKVIYSAKTHLRIKWTSSFFLKNGPIILKHLIKVSGINHENFRILLTQDQLIPSAVLVGGAQEASFPPTVKWLTQHLKKGN